MSNRNTFSTYTGANVSIFIGSTLITNAFGIQWELQTGKRPIYGYQDVHYKGLSEGQVIVLGSLYLNFQHPNYLSYVLNEYFKQKQQILSGIGDVAQERLGYDQNRLIGEYNSLKQGETFTTNALNSLFADKNLRTSFMRATTGNTLRSIRKVKQTDGTEMYVNTIEENTGASNMGLVVMETLDDRANDLAVYARPDQFDKHSGTIKDSEGIDIVITYGDPTSGSNGVNRYQPRTGIVLKNVSFLGESSQVMADDQPVMEVYKFMASRKEYLFTTSGLEDSIEAYAGESAADNATRQQAAARGTAPRPGTDVNLSAMSPGQRAEIDPNKVVKSVKVNPDGSVTVVYSDNSGEEIPAGAGAQADKEKEKNSNNNVPTKEQPPAPAPAGSGSGSGALPAADPKVAATPAAPPAQAATPGSGAAGKPATAAPASPAAPPQVTIPPPAEPAAPPKPGASIEPE
jgi:hypothetical protein